MHFGANVALLGVTTRYLLILRKASLRSVSLMPAYSTRMKRACLCRSLDEPSIEAGPFGYPPRTGTPLNFRGRILPYPPGIDILADARVHGYRLVPGGYSDSFRRLLFESHEEC